MSGLLCVLFLLSERLQCLNNQLQLLDKALFLGVDEKTMSGHAVTQHHRDILRGELIRSIGRLHSFDDNIEEFATSAGFHIVNVVVLDRVHVKLPFGRCID